MGSGTERAKSLKARCPKIKDDAGTETAAMTGCTHKGAEGIIEAIDEMTKEAATPERSPYVDPSKD